MLVLETEAPLAVAVVAAIRTGDGDALGTLLRKEPALASARLGSHPDDPEGMSRTLLHVATDFPGHFPHAAETVAVLVAAGADVHARFTGPHAETPLHWAASTDDVDVLDALIDLGADIEASGAVIGGGTPLSDAVAFAQWRAARRLVERGARTELWHEAALGLMDRVEARFVRAPPAPEEVTQALWLACYGDRREAVEYLLARGADLEWVGYDGLTPLGAAERSGADALVSWLRARGAR